MPYAELKVLAGRQQGKIIPIATNKFLVGREQDCHLRPNSDLVSRHHCVFTVDEFTVRLRDLGSTNGTFVNDEPLKGQVVLKTGDRIRIGKLDFEIVIRETARVAKPVAAAPGKSPPPSSGEVPNTATVEDAAEAATAVDQSGADTSYDLPSTQTILAAAPDAGSGEIPTGGDTALIDPQQPPQHQGQPGQPMPGYPQQPGMPGYPPGFGGYPGMMPPGGQYPYGYGYPQYPYPYPQYPTPQYPMPYPQQGMPGYPQGEAPEAEAPSTEAASDILPPRLPLPEETGAKEPEPKPEQKADGGAPADNPSRRAADIMKQMRQRRPE